MRRIAVYGTLLGVHTAQDHLRLRNRMALVGTGTVDGVLLDLGGYPGLVPGDGSVFVEIYEVDDAVLAILDEFEDVASGLYERVREPSVDAWVYRYRGPSAHARRIESGDYRQEPSAW